MVCKLMIVYFLNNKRAERTCKLVEEVQKKHEKPGSQKNISLHWKSLLRLKRNIWNYWDTDSL